ncbi:MAG TPA: M1 family peptidase, partial [Flavilitoribacter sp.]|nr:M1 family peptidase [Flavilitoribacter sp.]
MKNIYLPLVIGVSLCLPAAIFSQEKNLDYNKFRQLYMELPTPNSYRTASGAPGHEYYQQRADYVMDIELDDDNQIVRGTETVTYFNQSPDPLNYIWLQLDQNMRSKESDTYKIQTNDLEGRVGFNQIMRMHNHF